MVLLDLNPRLAAARQSRESSAAAASVWGAELFAANLRLMLLPFLVFELAAVELSGYLAAITLRPD